MHMHTRGAVTVRFAEGDEPEVRRDFARVFLPAPGCAVYVAGAELRPLCAAVPNHDLLAESNDRTAAHFGQLLWQELRRAGGAPAPALPLNALAHAVMRCIGTRVAFEVAVAHLRYAAVLQPAFCIALCAPQAAPASRGLALHVVTFAFLRSPGRLRTLCIRSPDLLHCDPGDASFEFAVHAAKHATPAAEMRAQFAQYGPLLGPGCVTALRAESPGRPPSSLLLALGAAALVLAAVVVAVVARVTRHAGWPPQASRPVREPAQRFTPHVALPRHVPTSLAVKQPLSHGLSAGPV
jgi:hypothetical protein